MSDLYNFESVMAVKIVVRKGDCVLLLKEPEINEWMPGRWGLPGGKLLLNEKISTAIERKIKTEIGLNIALRGIVQFIDILMPTKNVYHLVVLADYMSGEIGDVQTESKEQAWMESSDIQNMSEDDFTEFYNRSLLLDILRGKVEAVPMDMILEQNNRSGDVAAWMAKGKTN